MEETRFTATADSRAVLTNAADPTTLARVAAQWVMPDDLSRSARRLWDRACGQFTSGWVAYENLTDAVRTGFEAVDAVLRDHVADLLTDGKRRTLGPLITLANDQGRLTRAQHQWLTEYALRFRNKLTHSDGEDPLVLSPAMAAEMLGGIARFISDLRSNGTTAQPPGLRP